MKETNVEIENGMQSGWKKELQWCQKCQQENGVCEYLCQTTTQPVGCRCFVNAMKEYIKMHAIRLLMRSVINKHENLHYSCKQWYYQKRDISHSKANVSWQRHGLISNFNWRFISKPVEIQNSTASVKVALRVTSSMSRLWSLWKMIIGILCTQKYEVSESHAFGIRANQLKRKCSHDTNCWCDFWFLLLLWKRQEV